jgi:hypothetical protein
MTKSEEVARATMGLLSKAELREVADVLHGRAGDKYHAMLVLGRASATEYRGLVEKYLDSRDDPMLARLALQVLGGYWGLTGDYLKQVERFVRKVEWDDEDDVRLMAIDCVGSHLANNSAPNLLSLLLTVFRDGSERQIVREAAYCALAVAAGVAQRSLPEASRHFDLERDVDQSVIEHAESSLAVNHGVPNPGHDMSGTRDDRVTDSGPGSTRSAVRG